MCACLIQVYSDTLPSTEAPPMMGLESCLAFSSNPARSITSDAGAGTHQIAYRVPSLHAPAEPPHTSSWIGK